VPARRTWFHRRCSVLDDREIETPMYQVSQSATGQYVITHAPSNTVMIGDDLSATFQRMQGFVAELGQTGAAIPPAPASAPLARERWIVLAVLATLPFVWLGVLHVSLGRLVAELRAASDEAEVDPVVEDLRGRIDRVEQRLEGRGRDRHRPRSASARAPSEPGADAPECEADAERDED